MLRRNVKELVTINADMLLWMAFTDGARDVVLSYARRWQGGERNWSAIVVKQDGTLLDGRHRLCAAFVLGHDTIETTCC